MTKTKVDFDDIRDRWENLGIAFAHSHSKVQHADPEVTIIDSLKEFQNDRKILALILAWLDEFGDLVHVERIKALTHNLPANELAWLGGIAHRQTINRTASKNLRWQTIVDTIQKRLGKQKPHFETSRLDELQSKRSGADESFARFGIKIPKLSMSDPKKIKSREVVKKNLWLQMRLLFGTNWRADVATSILLGLAQTSYQARKVLGCSPEAAHRNWNALKEVEVERVLKGLV